MFGSYLLAKIGVQISPGLLPQNGYILTQFGYKKTTGYAMALKKTSKSFIFYMRRKRLGEKTV
jgi:hypothetical protein